MNGRRSHTGGVIDTVNGCTILNCTECGFVHVVPLPNEEELKKFYEKDFYTIDIPDYFKEYEEDGAWWMDTYRNHYSLIAPHAPGHRIVDIGSGPGYFLKCGQELGWQTLGVEPSEAACRYARETLGATVVEGFFTPGLLAEEKPFDAAYVNLVLEHIPDPHAFIRSIRLILRSGGILFLLVPNDFNRLQKVARATLNILPWWVVPHHHLNYFSFDSLRTLLTAEGFEIVDTLATFPMEFFLLSGDNYVGDSALGRRCHTRRKEFEQSLYAHDPETLNRLYRSLARENIGREAVFIARSKSPDTL